MRNISTDALAPWDQPSWTDGNIALHDQFNLTAHEARIGRWCFDGDGDDGGEADAPDYTGLEDVQGSVSAADAAAAAAAEADAAQDPDMGFDQDAIDDALGYAAETAYDVDYNAFADLAGIGKYDEFNNPQPDIFDQQIAKADAEIANSIQADARAKGYDVAVDVDPNGTFSYTAGSTGSFGDVAAVAGSQMAQGLMSMSPTAQIAQALGAPAPDFSLSPKDQAISYGGLDDSTMGGPVAAAPETISDAQIMDDFNLGLQQQMNEVSTSPDPFNNYVDAMVEAEEALLGGGYYDEVFGSNDNMAFTDQGGDNGVVEKLAPPVVQPPVQPPPPLLGGYQPPAYTPAQFGRLGLLAPSQLYGSAPRRALINNYIQNYPTLDQAFTNQFV